ncbi:16067_t:CDS:1, partial [Cetraspora pellucida]
HVTCTIIDLTWQPKPRNQQVLSELSPTNLPDNLSVVDLNKYKVFCRKDQHEHIIQLVRFHFSLHPLIPTEN